MAQKVQEFGKLKEQTEQLKKERNDAIKDSKIWEMLFKSLQDKYEGTNVMIPDKEALQMIKQYETLKLNMKHLERDRNDAKKDTLIWEKLFKSLEETYKGTNMMVPSEHMLTVMKELQNVKMELKNVQRGAPTNNDRKSIDISAPHNTKPFVNKEPCSQNMDRKILQLENKLARKESENSKLRASLAKQRESCKKTRDLNKRALHDNKTTLILARAEIDNERENHKRKVLDLQANIKSLEMKIAASKMSDNSLPAKQPKAAAIGKPASLESNGSDGKLAASVGAADESGLLAEIRNLKKELDSTKDELNATKNELDSTKEELNSTIADLKTSSNVRRSSTRLSEKAQSFDSCVEDLALTILNNDLESEVKDLRKRVDEYDTSINQLVMQHSKDIDALSQQNVTLTEANEMLREVYVDQQKENDTLKKQMEVLQKEIETVRGESVVLQNDQIFASRNQIDSLIKDNDILKSEKNTLVNENTKLQETIVDMEDTKKSLDEYNDFLQKDYDSLKAINDILNKNNKSLENEKVRLEDEIKHLKEEIVVKEGKYKSMEELRFNLERKIKAFEDVQNNDNLSDDATVILDAESSADENRSLHEVIDIKDVILEQEFVPNSDTSLKDNNIISQVDKNNTSVKQELDLERLDKVYEYCFRNQPRLKRKTESSALQVNAGTENLDILIKRVKTEDGPNISNSRDM